MVKMECDVCGFPIDESVTTTQARGKLKIGKKTVCFEVHVGVGSEAAVPKGTGELCIDCLKLAMVKVLEEFPSRKAQPGYQAKLEPVAQAKLESPTNADAKADVE